VLRGLTLSIHACSGSVVPAGTPGAGGNLDGSACTAASAARLRGGFAGTDDDEENSALPSAWRSAGQMEVPEGMTRAGDSSPDHALRSGLGQEITDIVARADGGIGSLFFVWNFYAHAGLCPPTQGGPVPRGHQEEELYGQTKSVTRLIPRAPRCHWSTKVVGVKEQPTRVQTSVHEFAPCASHGRSRSPLPS